MTKTLTTKIAAVLIAGATLAACNGGYYPNTAAGVAAGTVAGAGLGALAGGDDVRNVLVGAGAGAAAGGLAGYAMDGGFNP